jgi:hypothetical protein
LDYEYQCYQEWSNCLQNDRVENFYAQDQGGEIDRKSLLPQRLI